MQFIEESSPVVQMPQAGQEVERKIHDRSAKIGVIGLGHVGLTFALEMAKAGFHVTGIDIDNSKAESVNQGRSPIAEVSNEVLQPLVAKGKIKATQSLAAMENLDAVIICVPTPLKKTRMPDLSYLIAAVEAVRNHLHPGHLIVLESTTYPSTARKLVLPILEKTGLLLGQDFFLAYSPALTAAVAKNQASGNIPRVMVGMTSRCTQLATLLYQQFIERIVPVCSPDKAHMARLLEKTLSSVNVARVNELAVISHKLGINIEDVIEQNRVFDWQLPGRDGTAGHVNEILPFSIADIMDALNEKQKSLKGSKILTLGISCKADTSDFTESPAIEIMRGLYKKGAIVYYSDPNVPNLAIDDWTLTSLEMTPELLQSMDCVLVLTDHSAFNHEMIAAHSFLILDKRNALKDFAGPNVVRS